MTTPPPPPPDPGSGEGSAPPPDPAPGAGSGGSKGGIDFGSLSQGEKLVGLGAAAVLAVYVIWELITEDYGVTTLAIVLAVFVLGAMWLRLSRPAMTWPVPYTSLLRVAGYMILVVGVVDFIDELKRDIFEAPGGTLSGALVFYAASAIAGFGAKSLD